METNPNNPTPPQDAPDLPDQGAPDDQPNVPSAPAPATDDPARADTADQPSEEDQWKAEQDRLRAAQNLPEGAVPEQRPQAFASPDESAMHSELFLKLKEADALPDDEPMGFEEYQRAQSDEQMDKAAENSSRERLYPGTRVYLTKEPHDGRPAVIMEVNFASDQDRRNAASGIPALSNHAEVESYIVRTRDSRTDRLEVSPEDVSVSSVPRGWGRGE